jgi:hypothetical protein
MTQTMPAYFVGFFITVILASMGWSIRDSLLLVRKLSLHITSLLTYLDLRVLPLTPLPYVPSRSFFVVVLIVDHSCSSYLHSSSLGFQTGLGNEPFGWLSKLCLPLSVYLSPRTRSPRVHDTLVWKCYFPRRPQLIDHSLSRSVFRKCWFGRLHSGCPGLCRI